MSDEGLAGPERHAGRERAFRLLVATVGALFLAFAVLGGVFVWYDRVTASVSHTHQVRTGLGDVLQTLTDAESAQRAYVVTGDPQFVARLAVAKAEARAHVATIERLTADSPAQQNRIDQLKGLMATRLRVIDQATALRGHGDAVAAIRVIRAGEGVRAMEAIRVLLAELNAVESQLEVARVRTANTIRSGIIVALLGFAALLSAMFTLAMRNLNREREAEANDADRLRALLAERNLLIDEVNHRVKNSLQQIASVVRLQARASQHPEAREALQKTLDRIMAVGRVHEQLYRAGGDIGQFDAGAYVETLSRELVEALGRDDITLVTEVEPAHLHMRQAAPLAIILNELMTNALKYGCPPGAPCAITVTFGPEGEEHRLSVADNGPGLPTDFTPRSTASLGLRAIEALARQLGGRFVIESPATGACFAILFPRS